jgi:transposase-like protein
MHGLGMTELGVPALLVGAVLVIAVATLLLHLLFPPLKRSSRRTGLRIRRIRCPRCDQNLDRVERGGISVETCPRCQGAWLSQDQLEQITG